MRLGVEIHILAGIGVMTILMLTQYVVVVSDQLKSNVTGIKRNLRFLSRAFD